MTTLAINNQPYGVHQNPNAPRTLLQHVVEAEKTTYIAYRVLQLSERVSRAASMCFESVSACLSTLAGRLCTAWTSLVMMRLPEVTQKAWEAITTWGTVEGPEGHALRSNIKRLHDLTDCVASWFYSGFWLFGSTTLKNAGDVVDAGTHFAALGLAAEDHNMASKHLDYIRTNDATNDVLQARFQETKTEAFWRVLKEISCVAGCTFGLLGLTLGSAVISSGTALAIGLSSTIFALISHFYRETMTYKPVEFFKWGGAVVNGVRIN
ncbi:MAG: hypothetical protein KGQ49_02110 [Verrucomicrobia bacterium]|nr:hypothetical protein [Verrucomicrobiota bacterium]MBU6446174.1 hypothetical protein [Verrucomicrobiota bacterium]MDE3046747.1 hypothetical protein [Verrucomicrobiota bacterium]